MKVLVEKFKIKVRYWIYTDDDEDGETEYDIVLVVDDEPALSWEEETALKDALDANWVYSEVEVLDSWHEFK